MSGGKIHAAFMFVLVLFITHWVFQWLDSGISEKHQKIDFVTSVPDTVKVSNLNSTNVNIPKWVNLPTGVSSYLDTINSESSVKLRSRILHLERNKSRTQEAKLNESIPVKTLHSYFVNSSVSKAMPASISPLVFARIDVNNSWPIASVLKIVIYHTKLGQTKNPLLYMNRPGLRNHTSRQTASNMNITEKVSALVYANSTAVPISSDYRQH